MRKLFGTTLTIKKFSEDDLFDFTKSLQKKHSLDLSDDVLSLISQEFSRSPRKIIQFLNVLQTEIRLAEEQETTISNNRSNFAKGVITENIEFLVKILLIREEWTRLYERVNENPFILEDIYNQIDHGKQQIAFGSDTENERLVLTDEQRRFLESTRDISTRNVEAFFSNRDSFPGIPDDVPGFVLSQDWETIKIKYISKDILDFEALLSFVDNLFKRDVTRRNLMKRSGLNIISFIFKISEDHEYREPLLTSYYGKSN